MRYDRDEGFIAGAEFLPTERNEHVTRRRKMIRTRRRVDDAPTMVTIIISNNS